MSEIEAKVKYVKLARSLRTYGVSFFLVKVSWAEQKKALTCATLFLLSVTLCHKLGLVHGHPAYANTVAAGNLKLQHGLEMNESSWLRALA